MGWPVALWYPFAQALGSFATRPGFEFTIFAYGKVDLDGHLSVICGSLASPEPFDRASMITPARFRGARRILDWTQHRLASEANVSLSTVEDFEAGRRTPIGNDLAAVRRAFESAGVEFLNDESSGVRPRPGVAKRPVPGKPASLKQAKPAAMPPAGPAKGNKT
jgi:hypothetical protein